MNQTSATLDSKSDRTEASQRFDVMVCAIPVVSVAILLLIYLLIPDFYLTYVLELEDRENQAVEIVTFASAFLASIALLWTVWRIWRLKLMNHADVNFHGGAILVAMVSLASLFFAGEEISWGQTYFGGAIPDILAGGIGSRERNLHNSDLPIPVQSLGSIFLLIVFIGLPIAWQFRQPKGPLPMPQAWQPAIAEWPIVFCMAFAFVWKLVKQIYLAVHGQDIVEQSAFYMQFIEQINEQKEMLIAITLLIYSIYRVAWIRRSAKSIPDAGMP